MGSRIKDRKTVKRVFECFMVVEPPWVANLGRRSPTISDGGGGGGVPIVKSVFPASYTVPDVLRSAAQFAFPCPTNSGTVELFTFVLTGEDSKWTFGYCRHPYGSASAVLFLTFLPWQEIFYRTLNYCAEIDDVKLVAFLDKLYSLPVPDAGTCLYVPTNSKPFICPTPSDLSLPSIPENRNVSEFYNALGTESMLTLFSALLAERRIVVTSKKISRLSSIVVACNLFLFPMSWQHIFIPVLPSQLQDYLTAPMPFLIGVPQPIWDRLPPESLGQLVRVDADSDTVTTPFPEDLESMPHDVVSHLRKNLTGERVLGDGLARAFLRALAQFMGHYQDAIRDDGQSFDFKLFVQFAHPSHRHFIEDKLQRLQIFEQFIEERLQKVREGECESDEFEMEALGWRSSRANGRNGFPVFKSISGRENRTAIKKAGKAVIMSVKRESGNIIDSVKKNSALKSAMRSVKESGKSVKHKSHIAVSDIKSKFHGAGSSRNVALESNHSEGAKAYRRQTALPTSSSSGDKTLRIPPLDGDDSIRSREDNLIHLMPFSSSASKMNDLTSSENSDRVLVRPRLSKSEENLIDLDTPDGLDAGFTLENPLYDLVSNNNVFEDTEKTDAQLLVEYGLSDYFSQMNVRAATSTSGEFDDSFADVGGAHSNGVAHSRPTSQFSNGSASNGKQWATFE